MKRAAFVLVTALVLTACGGAAATADDPNFVNWKGHADILKVNVNGTDCVAISSGAGVGISCDWGSQ